MRRFGAFDLTIDSEIPFIQNRGETPSSEPADITISLDPVLLKQAEQPAVFPKPVLTASPHLDDLDLVWCNVASYHIRNLKEILIRRGEAVTDQELSFPLSGLVISLLLEQRGLCVLHASAVHLNERVYIFAGPKGQGKSTMVAAMVSRGAELIADDVIAIDTEGEGRILPGFEGIKLNADSLGSVGLNSPRNDEVVIEGTGKTLVRPPLSTTAHPLRTATLFILQSAPTYRLEAPPRHLALIHLMGQSQAVRLGAEATRSLSRGKWMSRYAKLSGMLTTKIFHRPQDLAKLNESIDWLASES